MKGLFDFFCPINLSVRMPRPIAGHISSSLAEVSPWPTAYVSEQHGFCRHCTDALEPVTFGVHICYNGSFSYTQLILVYNFCKT